MVGGMKPTVLYYRVDRRQISFIKFILEAYDNMAVVTTLDPHQAVIRVTIAAGCAIAIRRVLFEFENDFDLVEIDQALLTTGVDKGSIAIEERPIVSNENKKTSH